MIEATKRNTGKAEDTVRKSTMIKNGITNTPIDCFHVGGYKYTNLNDAVAEAERLAAADGAVRTL